MPEQRVHAIDIELHVTDTGGDGPPLVWLHGAGPGASGMSNFRHNLPAFDRYRNLVIDLPRFGQSDVPVIQEPFAPYAAQRVAAVLQQLDIDRCSVIGNSMGGATAIALAATEPQLVDRLVLMAAAGTIPADWDGGMPPGIAKIMEWIQEGPSERLIREFAELQVHDPSVLTDELLAERLKGASRSEVVETNPRSNLIPGDLNPLMPQIQAPALLLWGREDNFIPLEWGLNAVRLIPEAELRVVPHCGHWMQFEHRERFNAEVLAFLGGDR